MKIKRFQARTFSEALALVKREMGTDAVILSTEEQKGRVPSVEVTAAVDYEAAPEPLKAGHQQTGRPEVPSPPRAEAGEDVLGEMRREIRGIRTAIEDMKNRGYEVNLPEKKRKLFRYLRSRAISDDFAVKLCERSGSLQELVSVVAADIPTYDEVRNRKVIMVIGPTGVGKTTTIAKLAARAMRNGKRVALVNLDTYRIGAVEQIRIYAKIMGIPLDIVSGGEELKKSVLRFGNRDVIFVDTTGRNPKDENYIQELRGLCGLGIPMELHLLMSATSDEDFLAEVHKRYRDIPVDCIGMTKTDEAVKFGSIYNLSTLFRKPVAYITTGQQVPQDIDFPNGARLAGMILNTGASS